MWRYRHGTRSGAGRLRDTSEWYDRLRWIWSRPVRQLHPPTSWGDFTDTNLSAWTPDAETQAELAALVEEVSSTGPGINDDRRVWHRRSGRYVGLAFAAPALDWSQPDDLASREIMPDGIPHVLDGTPGESLETWVVGGGALFSPGDLSQTRRYEDPGCRIEALLLASAIAAGEANGVTAAGAWKAPWLPEDLRRDLSAAAQIEARHYLNIAPDRTPERARTCPGCVRSRGPHPGTSETHANVV